MLMVKLGKTQLVHQFGNLLCHFCAVRFLSGVGKVSVDRWSSRSLVKCCRGTGRSHVHSTCSAGGRGRLHCLTHHTDGSEVKLLFSNSFCDWCCVTAEDVKEPDGN